MTGSVVDLSSVISFTVSNDLEPVIPKVFSFLLPLPQNVPSTYDLRTIINRKQINFVQTICVNNFGNATKIVITTSAGQALSIGANSFAILPLFLSLDNTITFNAPNGSTGTAHVCLTNFQADSFVYQISETVSQAGSNTVITNGGTAVVVFPGGSIINQGIIVNPPEATESLFVDWINTPGTTAPGVNGTTFEVQIGQQITVPPVKSATMANAITNGHTFTAVSL